MPSAGIVSTIASVRHVLQRWPASSVPRLRAILAIAALVSAQATPKAIELSTNTSAGTEKRSKITSRCATCTLAARQPSYSEHASIGNSTQGALLIAPYVIQRRTTVETALPVRANSHTQVRGIGHEVMLGAPAP